uniref:Uncharacterized protein n=1 Tax=Onchocerca volvulus TaxID=6282 RepID=A0A8R1TXV6_ONCVO
MANLQPLLGETAFCSHQVQNADGGITNKNEWRHQDDARLWPFSRKLADRIFEMKYRKWFNE